MIKKIRILAGLFLFVAMMVGLYVGCPTLFTVDLAKPHYVEANNLELTRVYLRAIPKYESVIRDFPKSQYISYSELGIANCYKRLGESDKAVGLYDEFIQKYDTNENVADLVRSALNSKAELYRDSGQTDKAVAAFRVLVERFPGTESAQAAAIYLATADTKTAVTAPEETQNVPRSLDVVRLSAPAKMRVGEKGALDLELKNITGTLLYDVTIQTDLVYWKGLQVLSIKPNPISIQEFWGARKWVFKELEPGKTLSVEVAVQALEAGTFDSAMKVEATMEDTGVNERFSTRIEN